MRTAIVYPIPLDNWQQFEGDVFRFATTFKAHPPGADYELYAVCAWGQPTDELKRLFYGIKTKWLEYYEDGADIGAHQHAAVQQVEGVIVGMSTRCFFHRHGWLKRLVDARAKHGFGMYGTGDFELRPHIRTCAYSIDTILLGSYPVTMMSRADTSLAEAGPECLTKFVQDRGGKVKQVTWDGEQDMRDWRKPPGIFRNGEQNAMLVWDRHTEIYRNADPEYKLRLERLSNGE